MPDEPKRTISPERQVAYYAGMGCIALGFLLFISNFFMGPKLGGGRDLNPGDHDFWDRAQERHNEFGRGMDTMMFRAVGGMVLMMIGGGLMAVGRMGLAGSGVVLDPEKARKDLEPWNRAAGGMANDALEEVDLAKKLAKKLDEPAPAEPVVKVRCRGCSALNDEHAKFCNQCGAAM